MQLIDDTSKDTLLLGLCLLLVTWTWRWVGNGNLGGLLGVGEAYAGGQGHRGLRVKKKGLSHSFINACPLNISRIQSKSKPGIFDALKGYVMEILKYWYIGISISRITWESSACWGCGSCENRTFQRKLLVTISHAHFLNTSFYLTVKLCAKHNASVKCNISKSANQIFKPSMTQWAFQVVYVTKQNTSMFYLMRYIVQLLLRGLLGRLLLLLLLLILLEGRIDLRLFTLKKYRRNCHWSKCVPCHHSNMHRLSSVF